MSAPLAQRLTATAAAEASYGAAAARPPPRRATFVRESVKTGAGWLEVAGELGGTVWFRNLAEVMHARDVLDAEVRRQLEELDL